MLPNAVKAAVVTYILERLEQSGLNYNANPKYELPDFLRETMDVDEYVRANATRFWDVAVAEFNQRHPLNHRVRNGAYVRFREGLPDPPE